MIQDCSKAVQQYTIKAHSILWPGTTFNTAQDITTSDPELLIKCFHDNPTVEESSALIPQSSMKGLEQSTVVDIVLHEVSNPWSRIESHVVPAHGIKSYVTSILALDMPWVVSSKTTILTMQFTLSHEPLDLARSLQMRQKLTRGCW